MLPRRINKSIIERNQEIQELSCLNCSIFLNHPRMIFSSNNMLIYKINWTRPLDASLYL